MNKIILGIIIFVIIGIGLANFYNAQKETGDATSPFQTKLSFSDKPLLNTPVTLTLSFKSTIDAQNTYAKIELPDGFELVSGSLEWQGDLKKDEEQKIEIVVKSTNVGYYQLKCFINPNDFAFGNSDTLYVEVSQNDAIIGSKLENNWYKSEQGQVAPIAENNEQIESELIILQNPELDKEFTISYRLTPLIDLPERTQISLVLPPKAFELVDVQFPEGGETYEKSRLIWVGSIDKDETVEIKANLKVINTGWGSVYGAFNVQPNGEITELIQDVKIADLYVDKYKGNFTIR